MDTRRGRLHLIKSVQQFPSSPEQDLPGVYSARAFVGWYNGLPAHRDVREAQ